jgi:hypothetical protein
MMKHLRYFVGLLGAVILLIATPTSAAAQGPIDEHPPQAIEPQPFVSDTVASAITTSTQHRQGPAPCLNEGGGFSHIPELVDLSGSIK